MKKLFVCFVALIAWGTGHTHDMGNVMQDVLPSITYIRAQQFQTIKEVNPETKQVVEKTIEVTPVIGTGFVVNDNIVVTNHHVIARAITFGTDIYVSFIENNERHKAVLIGYDKITDVALLRIEGEFPSVKICDCRPPRMGEEVFTISHFYGIGWSATNGIISSADRNDPRYPYVKNMQLQILSGSGSSGGAVFNKDGHVIGLNRAILSMNPYASITGNQRSQLSMVAFPVRNDSLIESVERILAEHVVERVDLGVQIVAFGADSSYHVNQDPNFFTGVMVFAVSENSSTTLRSSDIIISVDGETFTKPGELLRYLDDKYNAGDVVKFYVYRDEQVINIDVTLESVGG